MSTDASHLERRFSEEFTTDLLELHSSGTLTDVAYRILEAELRKRSVQIPERPVPIEERPRTAGFLRSHWNGTSPLWSAWWVLGVIGNLIALCGALLVGFLATDSMEKTQANFRVFLVICFAIFTPYLIFSVVSVWRCSSNTNRTAWGLLAKAGTLLWVLKYLSVLSGRA